MELKQIAFQISRYKPEVIDPPRMQAYLLAVNQQMTVLDCLEKIRLEQDATLMYRHSCHHSSCGTCACRVNGKEMLACTTNVWTLGQTEITLEPLKGFARVGDLVVDMSPFYRDIEDEWTCLDTEIPPGDPRPPAVRFERCIECGCCISACPIAQTPDEFMGPAALAAIHREMIKSPQKKEALLALATGPRGESRCQRALACSRVCPTGVYPARHIADLRRAVARAES